MRSRRGLLFAAGVWVVFILAFFLQDVVEKVVVTPLAYIWWVVRTAYAEVPQLLLWVLLLAVLIFILVASLMLWVPAAKKYAEPARPAQGPVETLSGWITRSRDGVYYKWMIANRLGKLAGELEDRMMGQSAGEALVESDGNQPSGEVQRYFKAGLEESFADYPRPMLPFMRRQSTPFDLEIDQAVEYLESKMEARSGK
jgi:hypothetical protein